jgi:hypothetical protein
MSFFPEHPPPANGRRLLASRPSRGAPPERTTASALLPTGKTAQTGLIAAETTIVNATGTMTAIRALPAALQSARRPLTPCPTAPRSRTHRTIADGTANLTTTALAVCPKIIRLDAATNDPARPPCPPSQYGGQGASATRLTSLAPSPRPPSLPPPYNIAVWKTLASLGGSLRAWAILPATGFTIR